MNVLFTYSPFIFMMTLKPHEQMGFKMTNLDIDKESDVKKMIELYEDVFDFNRLNELPFNLKEKKVIRFLVKTVSAFLDKNNASLELRKLITPYLEWDLCEKFKLILKEMGQFLSWGKTTSYKKLGQKMGFGDNYARVIAKAMAANPFPLIFPCHRVLLIDNKIGRKFGVMGGLSLKKMLLEREGVFFFKKKSKEFLLTSSKTFRSEL
jgi:O-6-methylguanine DNA methyltransferase